MWLRCCVRTVAAYNCYNLYTAQAICAVCVVCVLQLHVLPFYGRYCHEPCGPGNLAFCRFVLIAQSSQVLPVPVWPAATQRGLP